MSEKDKHTATNDDLIISRRNFFRLGAGLGALALTGRSAWVGADEGSIELPFANGTRPLVAYPQKRPLMVKTSRAVNLETPFHVFNEGVFTPNDAFFVRWNSSAMPTQIDTVNYRINVRVIVVDSPCRVYLAASGVTVQWVTQNGRVYV